MRPPGAWIFLCLVGKRTRSYNMNLPVVLKYIIAALLIYLVYCTLLFLMQRRIIFPRPPFEVHPRAADVPQMEKMWLATSGGQVEAWFLPAENQKGPAPALIYAHGNAGLIDSWPETFYHMSRRGIGALLVEYPGYGRSEGSPSQESIAETFAIAYDTLVARADVDPSRIVLIGRSLGGGAVCTLAAQRPSAALVLISTFTSIRTMAYSRYFAPSFLVHDPFDNLTVVRQYANPLLILHGTEDSLIPFHHAQTLHQTASKSTLWTYPSNHNDCPPDWKTFFDKLAGYLHQKNILPPTQ